MGGSGSGTWYRWNKRTTTEEVRRLDIRYLHKHGLLEPNRAGLLSWTQGGESIGNISYTTLNDQIVLRFRWRRHGDDWEPVKQTIWFDETPCNYGGSRKWFSCPDCDQRAAVLYLVDKLFLCRKCYQLPYTSQGEDYLERLARKAGKISDRLGMDEEDGVLTKPKGMHWQTFDRLIQAENATQERMNNAFLAKYGMYM